MFDYLVISGDKAVIDFGGCKDAMKEYAKMWIDRAAMKANHTTCQDILKLKKEIDAQ